MTPDKGAPDAGRVTARDVVGAALVAAVALAYLLL